MTRNTTAQLVVLAMLKAPRIGEVKTRLARDVGDHQAVAIYQRLVEHQMQAIPRGWNVEVHFAPADAAAEMRQWLIPAASGARSLTCLGKENGAAGQRPRPTVESVDAAVETPKEPVVEFALYPQCGDDLGARLIHATTEAFARGAEKIVVIGGDCPGLDSTTLQAAARALDSVDVVLGPAEDGGYYLIGLKRPEPGVFREIRWSSETVLESTLDRIREAGLSCVLLERKGDVDDLASWRRLEPLLSGRPVSTGSTK